MPNFTLTVAVPAYSRVRELGELLDSFLSSESLPEEVLIAEDSSPERPQIRIMVNNRVTEFATRGCVLRLWENDENLGYDGNVRSAIAHASGDWVMLLGNDDVIAKDGVAAARRFLQAHPNAKMCSRTFFRFDQDWRSPIGVSRIRDTDHIFTRDNCEPAMAFRLCGFVGGLFVNRRWAQSVATDRYDGTLYYQMYLAFTAFCGSGIGYIASEVVGGRAGNPPLFGAAKSEKALHLPGSYRPAARAHMWSSVMRIAREVGDQHGVDLLSSVRHELDARQSFHVYEMMSTMPRHLSRELGSELRRIGLQEALQARFFLALNCTLGAAASHFYRAVRKLAQ